MVGGAGLPMLGEVRQREDGQPPYVVVGPEGVEHEPVTAFLLEMVARDCSMLSVRSYAFALLGWLRFLAVVGVGWDRASSTEVRDYVLWLRSAANPQRPGRPGSRGAGNVNPVTGKTGLEVGYAPATINHRLSVLRAFYEFHVRDSGRPLVNPVPSGERCAGHHNPMEPFPARRRAAYRQRVPDLPPRAIPDEQWAALFDVLGSDRDRAMFTLLVSSGARAEELLGLHGQDVDYGRQLVCLVTKGSRARRWVSASPESFVWLARYLTSGVPHGPAVALWWTLRRPYRRLDYWALRAVLRRANSRLGSDWVLHDLRHTCAVRLAGDPAVSLVDVQQHLRHQQLTTTVNSYLRPRADEVIARVQQHQRQRERQRVAQPQDGLGDARWRYDPTDLDELFGGDGA